MQSARTTSSLSAASPESAIRLSAYAVAGSIDSPFSVISWMVASTRSANVSAPGSRHEKRIVVVDAKVVSPVVRSRSMEYDATSRSEARAAASSRVRLVPGMLRIMSPALRGSQLGFAPVTAPLSGPFGRNG